MNGTDGGEVLLALGAAAGSGAGVPLRELGLVALALRDLHAGPQELVGVRPQARAGDFAQAMMDLGATICTPRSPTAGVRPNSPPHMMSVSSNIPRWAKSVISAAIGPSHSPPSFPP